MTLTMQPVPATSVNYGKQSEDLSCQSSLALNLFSVRLGTYAFMPSQKDSAVDPLTFTAQLESLVEILHEGVSLVDRDGFESSRDVGRFGAVNDL